VEKGTQEKHSCTKETFPWGKAGVVKQLEGQTCWNLIWHPWRKPSQIPINDYKRTSTEPSEEKNSASPEPSGKSRKLQGPNLVSAAKCGEKARGENKIVTQREKKGYHPIRIVERKVQTPGRDKDSSPTVGLHKT